MKYAISYASLHRPKPSLPDAIRVAVILGMVAWSKEMQERFEKLHDASFSEGGYRREEGYQKLLDLVAAELESQRQGFISELEGVKEEDGVELLGDSNQRYMKGFNDAIDAAISRLEGKG